MSHQALDFARTGDVAYGPEMLRRARRVCGRGTSWARSRPTTACLVTGVALLGVFSSGLIVENARLGRQRDALIRRGEESEARLERDRNDLDHARRAIEDSLTRVGESPSLDDPSLRPLRTRLLKAALDYHQGTSRRRAGESVVGFEHALAKLDAATTAVRLGRRGDAYRDFRSAEWMLFDLLARRPGDREVRSVMAVCRQGLAELRTERGDPEGASRLFDQAIEALSTDKCKRESDPNRLDLLARCELGKGKVALDSASWDEARSSLERGRSSWSRLVVDDKNEPIWGERLAQTLDVLARLDQETGRLDDAERDYRAAIAAREKISGADRPGLTSVRQAAARDLLRLGLLRRAAGDKVEADRLFEAASEARNSLDQTVPWLGWEGGPPDSGSLGPLPASFRDRNRAIRSAVRALSVWTDPCRLEPDDENAREALAEAYNALGLGLAEGTEVSEAGSHFQNVLETYEELLHAQPTVIAFQHAHALALCRHAQSLGSSFAAKKEFSRAGAEWNWSQQSHPDHLTFLSRQGDGHARLGAARLAWGWSDTAVAAYRISVRRFRHTASARPKSFIDQRGLALALTGLADALVEGEEAVRACRDALVAWKNVLDRLPAHPDANDGIARLLTIAADRADRNPERAEVFARRALSVVPDTPRYRVTLSLALLRLDKPEETIAALGELIDVDADAAIVASLAFHKSGNLESAISCLYKGIALAEFWIADDQALLGPSRSLMLEAAALIAEDDPDIAR